jgi:hypothetical protein
LEAEYERLRDEIFDVEEEIGALDCDYSPHATAAMALLTMRELTLDDDIKDALPWPHAGMFVAVLQLLRPLVGGAIAADVDRAIAAADDDGLESFMETLRDGALDESA